MSANEETLDGRLPLYDREALGPEQKELFDWMMATVMPWAEGPSFHVRTEAGRLIRPFRRLRATSGTRPCRGFRRRPRPDADPAGRGVLGHHRR
jgi:hypothetical protein